MGAGRTLLGQSSEQGRQKFPAGEFPGISEFSARISGSYNYDCDDVRLTHMANTRCIGGFHNGNFYNKQRNF